MKDGLRFASLCAVAVLATALHADELFPIYKSYQQAIAQGDAAGAKFYLSAGRRAELAKKSAADALAAMDVLSPKEDLRLHQEILEGDDATLIVVATVAENESTGRVNFVREQGTWKVLSEMWDLGGAPDDQPAENKVRQPENAAQREALRKLREMGFPEPTGDFMVGSAVDGKLEEVKLFIAAGYSPNTVAGGTPTIVAAATFGRPEVVQYLIEAGANVNAVDDVNTTALIRIADKCDQTATIRALLKAGARTDVKSAGGATAAQMAEWSNCTENVKALRARVK
jgi:glycosyltransferase involved in cell wall biosynthesis